MPAKYTPLRYPGGKAKLGPFLTDVFAVNKLIDGTYAEPYAGGAGAGLFLLFRGYATRFLLNDIDYGVAAFWRSVLNRNEEFARRIEHIPVTISEWDQQRSIYETERGGFDLGFAFFFLNRTNRSGIMNGGIIGGRKQKSRWGIDARFNKSELAARVRSLAKFKRSISVSRMDALDFLESIAADAGRVLTYLDPPYFTTGRHLYTNYYSDADHVAIAVKLREFKQPWLLTYDDCLDIRQLYRRFRIYESEVTYSARDAARGRELVVLGPRVKMPAVARARPRGYLPGYELLP